MTWAEIVRVARHRGGLSLRELAARAGTSHTTLSAYEHGRVSPTTETLDRIVTAAGAQLEVAVVALVADPHERGRELEAVLDLAGEFPARHRARLDAPVFGRRPTPPAAA